jgi:hypothetical protein
MEAGCYKCKLGFSSYQKCAADIRMISYGVAGDLFDEYMRVSESTCVDSMYTFGRVFLRCSTVCF